MSLHSNIATLVYTRLNLALPSRNLCACGRQWVGANTTRGEFNMRMRTGFYQWKGGSGPDRNSAPTLTSTHLRRRPAKRVPHNSARAGLRQFGSRKVAGRKALFPPITHII